MQLLKELIIELTINAIGKFTIPHKSDKPPQYPQKLGRNTMLILSSPGHDAGQCPIKHEQLPQEPAVI